jgi:hypothetical protein
LFVETPSLLQTMNLFGTSNANTTCRLLWTQHICSNLLDHHLHFGNMVDALPIFGKHFPFTQSECSSSFSFLGILIAFCPPAVDQILVWIYSSWPKVDFALPELPPDFVQIVCGLRKYAVTIASFSLTLIQGDELERSGYVDVVVGDN